MRTHAATHTGRRIVLRFDMEDFFAWVTAGRVFGIFRTKSGLMSAAGRQRICGIVVNGHPKVARDDYDRLKAVLHDASRNGPDAANRQGVPDVRAHLAGRISWVAPLNPRRGEKLRAAFAQVRWD